LTYYSTY